MAKARKATEQPTPEQPAEQPTAPEQTAPEQSAPEQEAPAPETPAAQPTPPAPEAPAALPAPPEPEAPAPSYVLKRKSSVSFHAEMRLISYDKDALLSAVEFAAVPARAQKFFDEVPAA